MIKEELVKRSPIRILEKTIHGGLGIGNLGMFIAKKGVGKTACLVHFATDHLLRGKKALHLSFSDDPQHIASWYQQVYEEVATVYKLEQATLIFDEILHNRLILHFKQQKSGLDAIINSLNIYINQGGFQPEIMIVDGLNFASTDRQELAKWREIAIKYHTQIWFSATLPASENSAPEFIRPYIDQFSVVIELNTQKDHIQLHLLKDHEATELEQLRLRLDPKSLLISNRRV